MGAETWGGAAVRARALDAGWRAQLLRSAGMSPDLSAAVAARPSHDVHALLQLLERGCPPAAAVRIAEPLREGRP